MKIEDARLCITCDEVYDGDVHIKGCPVCTSRNSHLVHDWLTRQPKGGSKCAASKG